MEAQAYLYFLGLSCFLFLFLPRLTTTHTKGEKTIKKTRLQEHAEVRGCQGLPNPPSFKSLSQGDRRNTKNEAGKISPSNLMPCLVPRAFQLPSRRGGLNASCLWESCRTGREMQSPSQINDSPDPVTDLECVLCRGEGQVPASGRDGVPQPPSQPRSLGSHRSLYFTSSLRQ